MMRHLCRVFGAFLILATTTGVTSAAPPRPRLTIPTDAKLDSQLRPRVVGPSTSPLTPLRTRGSKERVLVRVNSTETTDLKTLRRAGLRIDRVSAKLALVR